MLAIVLCLDTVFARNAMLQQTEEADTTDDTTPSVETAPEEPMLISEPPTDNTVYMPDFDPLNPGPDWWKYVRFVRGILNGFYGPFNQRARNYDCFSETYTLGTEMMVYIVGFKGMKSPDPENKAE